MLSWMNPKIRVGETAATGRGLYAQALIRSGEIVVVQGGKIIENNRVDDAATLHYSEHYFQIEKGFFIGAAKPESSELDGIFVMNHSCDPNCGVKGQISFVSMREIHPGEQLTFDYAMTDAVYPGAGFEEANIDCRCGSARCRKTITHTDWQCEELRKRYKGYFSLYIQDLIDELEAGS